MGYAARMTAAVDRIPVAIKQNYKQRLNWWVCHRERFEICFTVTNHQVVYIEPSEVRQTIFVPDETGAKPKRYKKYVPAKVYSERGELIYPFSEDIEKNEHQ